MANSANQQAVGILAGILVHRTKPILQLGQEFNEIFKQSIYEIWKNRVINDKVKVSTKEDGQMNSRALAGP